MVCEFGVVTYCFFTNWGLIISMISMLQMSLCTAQSSFYIRAYAHLTFTLSVIFQTVITIVYWAVLHTFVLHLRDIGEKDDYYVNLMIVLHLFPIFSTIYVYVMTPKLIFNPGHSSLMLPITCIYLVFNYVGGIIRGKYLYPFLTWEDWKSGVVVAIFIFGCRPLSALMLRIWNKFKSWY